MYKFSDSNRFLTPFMVVKQHVKRGSIITFDTETTSYTVTIDNEDHKRGFIYIWQMCIDGETFYSRDVSEFVEFVEILGAKSYRSIIWVHNLGFEFQFLRSYLEFEKVFARSARKPMYADVGRVRFRCSLMLSNMSLYRIGEEYKLPHRKAVGDLDYKKVRTPLTPLTPEEMGYCEGDVLVLYEYILKMAEEHGGVKNLPLTQTGFVRKQQKHDLREAGELEDLYTLTKTLYPKRERLFKALTAAFWGGITHASYIAVLSAVVDNIQSWDRQSSYPAVMFCKKYPMTPFIQVSDFTTHLKDPTTAKIIHVGLSGIKARGAFCTISRHKCIKVVNAQDSNGRIYSADYVELWLTDVDLRAITKFYTCKDPVCYDMYISKYDYLPRSVVGTVLKYYGLKTTLKGVEGAENMYTYYKQLANGIYGSMVMNPVKPEDVYDNENGWTVEPVGNVEEALREYYKHGKLNVYQWGVWVTAWARWELLRGVKVAGDDTMYSDTDSVKCKNDYRAAFEELNRKIQEENRRAAAHFGFTIDDYAPRNPKGRRCELGLWDLECIYDKFRTMSCKRYCYTIGGKLGVTCAGANIQALKRKLSESPDPFRDFNEFLVMSTQESGKTTFTYIDAPEWYTDTITDYTGREYTVTGKHCVHTSDTTFKTSYGNKEYVKFLSGMLLQNGGIIW